MSDEQLQYVQLLTSHQSRLRAYVLSLVGDPTQAQDIVQETNTVLWKKAGEFELGTNFSAWMLRIAKYQVMAHRKRTQRERLMFDAELTSQLAVSAEQRNPILEQRMATVSQCIEKLSDSHRQLIEARYQLGQDIASIAETVNRKANAVKQTLFRARKLLIDCVRLRIAESGA